MLYTNQAVESVERMMDFGIIHQVVFGEHGRGRRVLALTCPEGTKLNKGMNTEYTIGYTKSGRPRINKQQDGAVYMLLSSQGGYTRRGNGTIGVLSSQRESFEILSRGNGADGEAGRIGFWDCILLKVPNTGAIVRVKRSGDRMPSELYIIHEFMIYCTDIDNIEECCDKLGIEVKCQLVNTEYGLKFGEDWITL